MLPPAEKAAAASTSNVDLQWIAERSSCIWTAGNDDRINIFEYIHLNYFINYVI